MKVLSPDLANAGGVSAFGGRGVTVVNFGAFPGSTETSVTITGQPNIVAGSVVQAWIMATATTDHSADEHVWEQISVVAGSVVAGVGFTIFAAATRENNGDTMLYGQWTVAWLWI